MTKKASEWKLKSHSYQIADTGDYDGHWELSTDGITLITQDDHLGDGEGEALVKALNDVECSWYCLEADVNNWEKHWQKEQLDSIYKYLKEKGLEEDYEQWYSTPRK